MTKFDLADWVHPINSMYTGQVYSITQATGLDTVYGVRLAGTTQYTLEYFKEQELETLHQMVHGH